jgi:transposase
VDNPDEIITCDPGCCGGCGADLADAPVVGVQRRQIVEVSPPPKSRVTEYRIVTRACAACGATATATTLMCPPARVRYGPTVLARAAELVCAHYLPVARAVRLMHSMAGVPVSVGFMASVRGRAARMLEQTFLPRVRQLLRQARVLHVDETPARAAGGLEYVHVAATQRAYFVISVPSTPTIPKANVGRRLRFWPRSATTTAVRSPKPSPTTAPAPARWSPTRSLSRGASATTKT